MRSFVPTLGQSLRSTRRFLFLATLSAVCGGVIPAAAADEAQTAEKSAAEEPAAEKPAAAKAEASEKVSVFGEYSLSVPAVFKRGKPANRIIAHEFIAEAGEGDQRETARVTFMPAGGGVKANIDRWIGQFSGGDAAAQKSKTHQVGDWKVHVVDCSGRYAERMGGGPFAPGRTVQREDYAMAGAIVEHPKGRLYFVKMIGPAEVVKKNRKPFVDMVKSIK